MTGATQTHGASPKTPYRLVLRAGSEMGSSASGPGASRAFRALAYKDPLPCKLYIAILRENQITVLDYFQMADKSLQ